MLNTLLYPADTQVHEIQSKLLRSERSYGKTDKLHTMTKYGEYDKLVRMEVWRNASRQVLLNCRFLGQKR